jgi:hypothetical protein
MLQVSEMLLGPCVKLPGPVPKLALKILASGKVASRSSCCRSLKREEVAKRDEKDEKKSKRKRQKKRRKKKVKDNE